MTVLYICTSDQLTEQLALRPRSHWPPRQARAAIYFNIVPRQIDIGNKRPLWATGEVGSLAMLTRRPWTNNGLIPDGLIPDGSTAVTQVNWRHQQIYGNYRQEVNLATHGEDNLGLFKSFRYSRIFKLSFECTYSIEYKSHIKLTRYAKLKISFNVTTSLKHKRK